MYINFQQNRVSRSVKTVHIKDNICSKYTPKYNKWHNLKKFSRESMPPNLPSKARRHAPRDAYLLIFLPNIIPLDWLALHLKFGSVYI